MRFIAVYIPQSISMSLTLAIMKLYLLIYLYKEEFTCLDKIVFSSNGKIGNNSICMHEAVQDVIIDRVNIPPPVPTINVVGISHEHSQIQCVER